jgi:UvrD-like helicase C-terminal domain
MTPLDPSAAFFGGRIDLWEGHTRSSLDKLANKLRDAEGNSLALTDAVLKFMRSVASGFSRSAFGNRLEQEVRDGCIAACRGKPAKIQELGRILLAEPNHKGVGKMLRRLHEFSQSDPVFEDVIVDHYKEFWEAIRLGEFETVEDGLAEITHRRTYSHPKPPSKAISTIHKAKGLECDSVILMPCDATTFPDSAFARCLIYVALSRAKSRLLLVLSRANRSPLFTFN